MSLSNIASITHTNFNRSTRVDREKWLDSVSKFLSNEFIGCEEKQQLCDEIFKLKTNASSSSSEVTFVQDLVNLAKRYKEKVDQFVNEKIKNKQHEQLSNYHLESLCKRYRIEFNDRLDAIIAIQRAELIEQQKNEKRKIHKIKFNFATKLNELKDKSFLDDFIEWDEYRGFEINYEGWRYWRFQFESKEYEPELKKRVMYLQTLSKYRH